MEYIVYNEPVTLIYMPGKGSRTYHIIVPHSKDIVGKRGEMEVSGTIDGFPMEYRQLAPLKGQDKMLSINKKIRDSIGKSGGDTVYIGLYLLPSTERSLKEMGS